jgi:hypothetical protein
MLVTPVRHLKHVATGPHFQDDIADALDLDVEKVRPVPASPANVIAPALLRKPLSA